MTNTKVLQMVFGTDVGTNVTVSVDCVKDDVTPAQIKSCANVLIANKTIDSKLHAELKVLKAARIVETSKNELSLA